MQPISSRKGAKAAKGKGESNVEIRNMPLLWSLKFVADWFKYAAPTVLKASLSLCPIVLLLG
jgi:hypothetical protein